MTLITHPKSTRTIALGPMRAFCLVAAVIAILLSVSIAAANTSFTAQQVDQSLFRITLSDRSGSGFLYKDARTVITNRHVVEPLEVGDQVQMNPVERDSSGFTDLGDEIYGELVLKHPDLDMAVIRLDRRVTKMPLVPHAHVGDRYVPRGTSVMAHGFPGTLSPTVSTGIIAGHYRDPNGVEYYTTDAALSSGSSGGPVTNEEGELVGIATAVYVAQGSAGFNWGYVLPARAIDDVLAGYSSGNFRAVDIEALAYTVRGMRPGELRGRAIVSGIERIAAGSGSQRELVAQVTQFLDLTKEHVKNRPDTYEDGLAIGSGILKICLVRNMELMYRHQFEGQGTNNDMDTLVQSLQGWQAANMPDLSNQTDEMCFRSMEKLGNALKNQLASSIDSTENACDVLSTINWDNPVDRNRIESDDVYDVAANVAGVMYAMQMCEVYSGVYRTNINLVPYEYRVKFESYERDIEQMGSDIQGECVENVSAYLGFSAPEVDNAAAAQEQYAILEEAVARGYDLEFRDEVRVPPGESIYYEVDRYNHNGGLVAFAKADDGQDIDLYLLDPNGNALARDDMNDSYPVAGNEELPRETCTVVIKNEGASDCTVDVLVYVKKR